MCNEAEQSYKIDYHDAFSTMPRRIRQTRRIRQRMDQANVRAEVLVRITLKFRGRFIRCPIHRTQIY